MRLPPRLLSIALLVIVAGLLSAPLRAQKTVSRSVFIEAAGPDDQLLKDLRHGARGDHAGQEDRTGERVCHQPE
ncbi:MAG: hypothetical protein ACKOEC_04455 [Acidimicrobiia bacterium]